MVFCSFRSFQPSCNQHIKPQIRPVITNAARNSIIEVAPSFTFFVYIARPSNRSFSSGYTFWASALICCAKVINLIRLATNWTFHGFFSHCQHLSTSTKRNIDNPLATNIMKKITMNMEPYFFIVSFLLIRPLPRWFA